MGAGDRVAPRLPAAALLRPQPSFLRSFPPSLRPIPIIPAANFVIPAQAGMGGREVASWLRRSCCAAIACGGVSACAALRHPCGQFRHSCAGRNPRAPTPAPPPLPFPNSSLPPFRGEVRWGVGGSEWAQAIVLGRDRLRRRSCGGVPACASLRHSCVGRNRAQNRYSRPPIPACAGMTERRRRNDGERGCGGAWRARFCAVPACAGMTEERRTGMTGAWARAPVDIRYLPPPT